LIKDYRSKWQEPDMPFFWVQLSSVDTPYYQSQYWPQFRDEQRQLLNEVSDGGMAVCSDIGLKGSVHPTNKKVVGERLARWALHTTYGENIIPSGPLPLAANFENGQIVISFQYAGKGLQTSDGKLLRGFSVDGKNEIPAFIRHKTVVINTSVQPQYIYYGWKPFTDANLVNSALLPASTFKIPVR
jgi:sialate O-acetylesterase